MGFFAKLFGLAPKSAEDYFNLGIASGENGTLIQMVKANPVKGRSNI